MGQECTFNVTKIPVSRLDLVNNMRSTSCDPRDYWPPKGGCRGFKDSEIASVDYGIVVFASGYVDSIPPDLYGSN